MLIIKPHHVLHYGTAVITGLSVYPRVHIVKQCTSESSSYHSQNCYSEITFEIEFGNVQLIGVQAGVGQKGGKLLSAIGGSGHFKAF